MMAVGLSEDAIRPYLCSVNTSAGKPALNIACVNSPNNVTISGDESLIDQLRQQLDKQSVFARKLRVSVAYHSQQINAISEEYIKLVGSIDPDTQFGKVPMISSVTKTRATGEQLTQASYWAQNMVSPVQFSAAILAMCESSAVSLTKKIDKSHAFASVVDHLVEVGPHAALQGPIREILRISPRGQDIGYSSVLRRYSHAIETTLSTVGELHCMGCQVDLRAVNEPDTSSRLPRSLLVNLPEYPFDHSQTHWFESRLSKNYRSRAYAPLELLGVRSNDWNRFDSRWRNFIRTREMPWVEQHKVNGTILYPGAGMLAMAIEAAKQLASPAGAIQGYVLHNVHFENAMNLSSSSGVLETQISLRPAPSRKDPSYMYDFTVYSIESEDWQTNCHGVIEVEFQEDQEDWEGRMKAARFVKLQDVYQDVISKCSHSIDTPKMYEFLKKAGLDYGPVFQATQNQRISNTGEAAAEVTLFGQPDDDPEAIQPHVIHPASLDAILHLCFTALSSGGVTPMATSVPSRVKYMWISDRGLSRWEAESLTAFSKLTHKNGRGFSVDTGALDRGDAGQLRFFIEGLELTNITHTPPPDNLMPHPDQSYLNIDSKIALSKLSADETASYLEGKHQAKEDPTQFFHDLRALLKISLSHLVQMTDAQTYEQGTSWKKHYLDWAHHHLGTDLLEIETPQSLEEACSKVDRNGCVGRIYAEVARNLAGIFTGEVDPLELLFSSDLAKDYYEEIATYKSNHQFAEYLDLLAHEKPGLSILEVGGGTGAGTRNIVKALKAHAGGDTGTLRCRKYDFTDVSASFFDKARHEFEDVKLKMNYRILDIEKDITEQGFEDNSYDVVIAINVLHVTQSVKKSLQNIRKAMKAGGKLIVQEPLKPDGGTLGFIFGLLPGWWLGVQDGRQLSPSLSVEAWDAVLKECGFSGPEMVFRDFDQYHAHETGVFITTAVEKSSTPRTLKEHVQPVIIVGKGQELEEDVARDLIYPLSNLFGIRPHFQLLSEAALETDLASKFLIFLDHRSVFLDTMTEETWSQLQLLLLSARDLLWITAAGGADPNPGYGMLDGFSRVLRSEHYDLHLVTLALGFGNRHATEKIQHIMQIVEEMATTPVGQNYEEDYVEIDGLLHIKRVVEANYVRAALETQLAPYMPVQVRLSEAPPFELDMMVTGQMNSMCYMQSSGATGELGPGMVEVEVKAVSLDRRDYNTTQGQNDDNKFGGFCAGIILRAGSDVSIRPGARVFGWCHGSFRSQVVMAADLVAELPGGISFSSACALIPPSLGVHYALVEEGRLRPHDRVLIHDGSSPVGQAAIKLCQELGVKQLWATTTSEQGRNCIVDTLGLPEENVLPVSSLDRQIKELAPKKAFDIVLAADFHPATPHSLSYVKPRGRYIQLSSTSGGSNELPKMLDIPSSVSLSQIDVRDTIDQDPRAMRESLGYSVKHASMAGNASFPHYTTSHLSEIFEHLRGCRDGERVVVDLNAEDTITVSLHRPLSDEQGVANIPWRL
jgi:NADPH:quinone reductase-like Zn-dependent oxidoreductase/ubiquinone/menaquinone biosynthesis C-methylase UbiE